MAFIAKHIRGFIYAVSAVGAALVYAIVSTSYSGQLEATRLEEWYGFISAFYVLCALVPTPLYKVFPQAPGKPVVTRGRRAIGISSFCLALVHAVIAFNLLQGFAGLPFLNTHDLLALIFGLVALIILFFLAATSFDVAIRAMGPWWKRLHRFVYLAGVIVVAHSIMLGSHFADASRLLPTAALALVAAVVMLEAARVDGQYAIGRWGYTPRFSWFFVLCLVIIVLGYAVVSGIGHVHH